VGVAGCRIASVLRHGWRICPAPAYWQSVGAGGGLNRNQAVGADRRAVVQRGDVEPIKQLNPAAMERAVITLERAFASDPMFTWMFPDPRQRSRSLRLFLRVPLQYGLRYGHVTESNGGMAVAIWLPPGREITIGGMIRRGMLTLPFRVGFRPFVRFAGANDVMGKFHKRFVPEPHWYLLIVGVDPELQGRGLGSGARQRGAGQGRRVELPLLSGHKRGTQPHVLSARRFRGRRNRSTGQGRTTWMGDATQRTGLEGNSVLTCVAPDGR
jgi:hypothetical protein